MSRDSGLLFWAPRKCI